jgi:hypothetical protein
MNRVVVLARQSTKAGVIDSLESMIPGPLKSLKMSSVFQFKFGCHLGFNVNPFLVCGELQ